MNSKIRQAVILAAGRGLRLMPLTKDTPKPLMKLGEDTLLELQLRQLKKSGIDSVVIHTSYLGAKIKEKIGNGDKFNLTINYAHSENLLGAGGGIIFAKDFLEFPDEQFLLLNGDVYTDFNFSNLLSIESNSNNSAFKLVLIDNPEHNKLGDFAFDHQSKVITKNALSNSQNIQRFTYSGISIISPEVFNREDIKEITSFSVLLEPYLVDNLVQGEYHAGVWHDIGAPDRLEKLKAII